MENLIELLKIAVIKEATDVHINSDYSVMFRIKGKISIAHEIEFFKASFVFNEETFLKLLKSPDKVKKFLEDGQIDFNLNVKEVGNFRLNMYLTRDGYNLAIRVLPPKPRNFSSLGLPKEILSFLDNKSGLILITGSTGSGKSTLAGSMLSYVNDHKNLHIITIEDPIEYIIENNRSLVHQREVGTDTVSFSSGLRSALRQDPDIIMIGELRDSLTAEIALNASETGHLVIATVHTNSASSTLERIISLVEKSKQSLATMQLMTCLKGIVNLKLIPSSDETKILPLCEVMFINNAIRSRINEQRFNQIESYFQTAKQDGMIYFEDLLIKYVKENKISQNDALQHATNVARMKEYLEKLKCLKF